MQIMKCPQKASRHYARVSRKFKISPFKAVDMKIFLINPASTLSLNGA